MQKKDEHEEVWQKLYVSHDIHADLAAIYTDAFFEEFATHFDKSPLPYELIKGVNQTVIAYLNAKWWKVAHSSDLLHFTGLHIIKAGAAAKQLQYSLRQIKKSPISEAVLFDGMKNYFEESAVRGRMSYDADIHRNGPDDPFRFFRELSGALSQSANKIIPLPHEQESEDQVKMRAVDFVNETNAARKARWKKLPAHYALEEAAKTFRPVWEQHSTKRYTQGRYVHERGDYASESTAAFYKIIAKIDTQVPESLAGTAIKNIVSQSKVD